MTESKKHIPRRGLLFGTVALAVCLLLLAAVAVPAPAATIAYWQFEEGPVDTQTAVYQGDWFLDSSGNGNHMWTWADTTAPTYRSDVPFATVPQTGAANDLSLQFTPNQDNYTFAKPINTYSFGQLTVEASVKVNSLDGYQVFVGKDGKPVASEAFPPMFVKFLDHNDLFEVMMIDASGVPRLTWSDFAPTVGEWYNLALVNDGSTMRFFIKGPGDTQYVEQGSPVAVSGGALIDSDGSWTVGRGMWDNGIADWINGSVDEVRVSDVALAPSEFLGVPEPSTLASACLGLLLLTAVAAWRRRS
ncbi:MAG: PEP-CTERM sorting domain-containing protein [Pirellulales bacterium]|nr:PEP-CTERM sorting domain-containing protein [Pirellulales bacterium]